MDETLKVESKLYHETDYLARVKEINQLKDTVSLFKIKEYELETENEKFKLEIEQLRRLSKVRIVIFGTYVCIDNYHTTVYTYVHDNYEIQSFKRFCSLIHSYVYARPSEAVRLVRLWSHQF